MQHTTAAILLAGGKSRRMGRDKAQLPLGGPPMAAVVYARLAEVFPRILVVGREQALPGAESMPDRHPGRGPLEGLATGLEALEAPQVLLVACDMPFLSVPLLRYLAAQPLEGDALLPVSERGPEPLLAVYSRRMRPRLRAFLESGEGRVMAFLAQLRVQEVPFAVVQRHDPSGASFRNLNRPEDYRAALRDLGCSGQGLSSESPLNFPRQSLE